MVRGTRRYMGTFLAAVSLLAAVTLWTPPVGADPLPPTYSNPRTAHDAADPFIIRVDGVYYAFTTLRGFLSIPVFSSTDLVNWSASKDALPELPSWGDWGSTWAPTVLRRTDSAGDSYSLMYYTVRETSSQDGCISVAISYDPPLGNGIMGPYTDDSSGPLVCQHDWNGSIDPSVYIPPSDAGSNPQAFLFWKTNEAPINGHRSIWSQPLAPDGRTMKSGSSPAKVMTSEAGWENLVIEGPTVFWDPTSQQHVLLYAAHNWDKVNYATGWALCTGALLTSCRRGQVGNQSQPLIAYNAHVKGPGGAETFTDESGNRWVVYHGYDAESCPSAPKCSGPRRMYIDRLCMLNGVPRTNAPTVGSQSSARTSDCLKDVNAFGWGASSSSAEVRGGWDIDSSSAVKDVTLDGPWPNQSVIFRGNPNLTDQTVKAEAQWSATGPSDYPKYGILASFKDWDNHVQMWLDRKHSQVSTYARVGGVRQQWQHTALTGFDFSSYHELRVVKTGTTFKFYLDGVLRQTRTFGLQSGQVGLITEDTRANYRNISQTAG